MKKIQDTLGIIIICVEVYSDQWSDTLEYLGYNADNC
jgi:hypothetical protein